MPTARPGISSAAISVLMKESMDLRRSALSGGRGGNPVAPCARETAACAKVTAKSSRSVAMFMGRTDELEFANGESIPHRKVALDRDRLHRSRLAREVA